MEMTLVSSVGGSILSELIKEECDEVVRKRWPGAEVSPCGTQGACSYTVLVSTKEISRREGKSKELRSEKGKDKLPGLERDERRNIIDAGKDIGCSKSRGQEHVNFIVQFRPERYALDIEIAGAAKGIYGPKCPLIEAVESRDHMAIPEGLRVYAVEFLAGTPYSKLQPRSRTLGLHEWARQSRLVKDFAQFVARGWPTSAPNLQTPSFLLSSSFPEQSTQMTGKVGASIKSRLAQLVSDLPTAALRTHAQSILYQLPFIESLPIVVNHGDVVPANILVEPTTGSLAGLVDWAEAEHLPFGTCLYGLEYLLGWIDLESNQSFVYFENVDELRDLFWNELTACIDIDLGMQELWKGRVALARDLGVLLWFGFAWDDGKIDRVVNRDDDPEVVECLEAFLRVDIGRARL
ncbi:hypothetical protein BU16DRAFT_109241 [Lophium mytilinum]|uniref:Aminoglycoside phosphotransferase domain-containing protein n=1 Tax=Lophium mytilinum TaxID=390894 RepID=A0A6A6QN10_9PEZI|nr:hypothetical protein BU16DRAFT_109241 [Lophium mytilinum]